MVERDVDNALARSFLARKNHRAVRQLEAIGPAPHPEPAGFATRVRWAADFGAEHYAELLKAPGKQSVWFEHSAHLPHLEEPERFRELLAKVRLGWPAMRNVR